MHQSCDVDAPRASVVLRKIRRRSARGFGGVSAEHMAANSMDELKKTLRGRGFTPRSLGPGETSDEALMRYLRARNYHADKAAAMYMATINWREECGVDELRKIASGAEVLGSSELVDLLHKFLPHAQTGFDRAGGPVIFKHMGSGCRIKQAVSEGISLDALARYNIWLNERYMDALASAQAREWSVIIDAAGWHLSLFDSYAFRFLKRTATTDGAHYPDLLHQMIIVNAPPMLAYAWRVIRTWVDAETREKIEILSESTPEHTRKILLSRFDEATLPAQYGGSAKPLPRWPTRAGIPRAASSTSPSRLAPYSRGAAAHGISSITSSATEIRVVSIDLSSHVAAEITVGAELADGTEIDIKCAEAL